MMGVRNPNHRNNFINNEQPKQVIEETVEITPTIKVKKAKTQMVNLYKLTKSEQVAELEKFGVSKKEIKKLKLEEDRVKKLFELINEVE